MKFFGLILIIFLLSLNIFSQDTTLNFDKLNVIDYQNPVEYEIMEVTISGIEFIQKEVLVSMSGLNVGQKIILPSEDITKVTLLNKEYSFSLREGEMFYFVITEEKDGEVYIETNKEK